jgi:hypothetical protein
MEREGLLPCLHGLATGPYTDSDLSSPYIHIQSD